MGYLEDRAALAGKVVVVAGGAGGLGWPISRDLVKAGARVAVCDRDPDAVERASAELSDSSQAIVRLADVREPEAMQEFFAEVDSVFGRLDGLVAVPGGGFVAPFMNTREKGWQAIIRQNFTYVLDTTQRAVQRMQDQGSGGSIVYVTSVEAHRAVPNRAVYGAMKAGVTNLAQSLALELALDGIRVNCVAPDIFPTPASGGLDPAREATESGAIRRRVSVPMGRWGTDEDLSGCLLFLLSDLSSYVTGTTLHVDGGTLASSGWFNWPGGGYMNLPPDEVVEALAAGPDGRP